MEDYHQALNFLVRVNEATNNYCEQKIKMELVLLGELSKWTREDSESATNAPLSLEGNSTLTLCGSTDDMQDMSQNQEAQDTRCLSDPYPKITPDSLCAYWKLWKSHGQRSLVGYSPWGHKESDTPEVT